jgi:hypothetical protein
MTALLIRRGWQKVSAIRHVLGGMADKSGHFNVFTATKNNEFPLFDVT